MLLIGICRSYNAIVSKIYLRADYTYKEGLVISYVVIPRFYLHVQYTYINLL